MADWVGGLAAAAKSFPDAFLDGQDRAIRREQLDLQRQQMEEARQMKQEEMELQAAKAGYARVRDENTRTVRLVKVSAPEVDLNSQLQMARIENVKANTAATKKRSAMEKLPTAGQNTAGMYAKRIEQAEGVFQDLESRGFDPTSLTVGAKRMIPGILGGMKGEELQLQEQAERNFVNAVLRRESGAAISPSEFASAEKQYFPRPGDSPEVLRQKAINRKIVGESLKAESGPAYASTPSVNSLAASVRTPTPKWKDGGLIGQSAMAADAPKPGYVEAGYEFLGGDPADQKNWRPVK